MPKTKRHYLKRKLAQALNHEDQAAERLIELYNIFEPTHPEYAAHLHAQITGLLQIQQFGKDFWERAWGKPPGDYNVWR